MFDGCDAAPNSERLWDPATGRSSPVPYGRNLFCAGHVQLADGRTLIVGGNISADDGLADTTIFDPPTNRTSAGPTCRSGAGIRRRRSSRTDACSRSPATTSSQDSPGQPPPFSDASVDSLPSIYNPTTNTWTDLTAPS